MPNYTNNKAVVGKKWNPKEGTNSTILWISLLALVTVMAYFIQGTNEDGNFKKAKNNSQVTNLSNEYWIRVAQGTALVIAIENGSLPQIDQNSNLVTPADCKIENVEWCRYLMETADVLLSELSDKDKIHVHKEIAHYTQQILQNCDLPDNNERKFEVAEESLPHPVPVFHCNNYLNQTSVVTHIRMGYLNKNFLTLQNTSHELIPRYFVLELGTGKKPHKLDWKLAPYPVQAFWLFRFHTRPGYFYQIRVTAIAPKHMYPPVSSSVIRIHDTTEIISKKPTNIEVVTISVNNAASHAKPFGLLRWESGSGSNASCSHDIFYMGEDLHKLEQRQAENAFWTELKELQFDQEYHVRVIEKMGNKEFEISTNLLIPSCLQMRGYSFKVCTPPPPTNVRLEKPTEYSFWIYWDPPKFITPANQLLYYNLTVDQIYTLNKIYRHPSYRYKNRRVFTASISGTADSIQVKKMNHVRGRFKVTIVAVGEAGISEPSRDFVYYHGLPLSSSWTFRNIFIAAFSSVGAVLLVGLVYFLKYSYNKRQRNARRRETFENYERDGYDQKTGESHDATKWELDFCALTLKEAVGHGNFGVVRKATLTLAGIKTTVAVKTLRVEAVDSNEVNLLWEEFGILKNLDPHMHVLGLKGIVTKHTAQPWLVVEYCDGGDFQTYLRNIFKTSGLHRGYTTLVRGSVITADNEGVAASTSCASSTFSGESNFLQSNRLPRDITCTKYGTALSKNLEDLPVQTIDLLCFSRQIAHGLEYLSSNKIIHRDLAARNILMTGRNKKILKISDFGMSRDVYEKNWYKMNSDAKIPIKWLAIESILKDIYTTKTDVWAFGILLWEIFTFGGNPYPGVENIKVFDLINNGYRLSRSDTCPIDVYMLMRQCWDHEPSQRPNFTAIRLILDDIIERTSQAACVSLESNPLPARNNSSEDTSSSQSPFSNDNECHAEPLNLCSKMQINDRKENGEPERVSSKRMSHNIEDLSDNSFQKAVNQTK